MAEKIKVKGDLWVNLRIKYIRIILQNNDQITFL